MATKKKMLQAAAGSAGVGGFTAIEDVFSTYLYTGNGSTQKITNGIALSEAVVPALTSHSFGGTEAEVDSQGNYFRVLSSQVIKWSSTGTFIWGKTLLSSSRFYQNIAIDSNDDVIVCQTNLATSQLDVYKFSGTDGTSLWKKSYSNVGDRSSIACFGTRIFIAGASGSESFYGFLIEINSSDGSVISSKYHVSSVFNYDLAIDATNSLLYVSGVSGTFGTIIKYDISGGGLTFVTSIARYYQNTTTFRSIAVDSSGDVYVAGQAAGSAESCVVKFNSSLTEQWRVFFIEDTNGAAAGRQSIAISDTGKVLARLGTYNSGSHVVSLNPSTGAVINNSYFSGVPGSYPGDRELIYRNGKFLLPTTSSLIYEIPDSAANDNLSAVPVSNTSAGYSPTVGSGPGEGANHVNLVGDVSFTVADVSTSSFTLQFNDAYEGSGGLVWIKSRSVARNNQLSDTERGINKSLVSNDTAAEVTQTNPSFYGLSAFNADGFSVGAYNGFNNSGDTIASWTFRKAPRFFDVVTYTGTGAARTITHNLGIAPGCIIVKATSSSGDWWVYHRSLGATQRISLNATSASAANVNPWNNTEPTEAEFSLSSGVAGNDSGTQYVAYLFAHDPLGPSGDGSDGLIACGSYTANGSTDGPEINLGWEPQWVMVKSATGSGTNWVMADTMRGFSNTSSINQLYANTSAAEEAVPVAQAHPTATGFKVTAGGSNWNFPSGATYIYIAIRRGPMRAPESGTEVFNVEYQAGTDTRYRGYLGNPVDAWLLALPSNVAGKFMRSRLQGQGNYLDTTSTAAEAAQTDQWWDNNLGVGVTGTTYTPSTSVVNYMFRRAPNFFDVVAYGSNNTSSQTISHNLGVTPEMFIVKVRDTGGTWGIYHKDIGNTAMLRFNIGTPLVGVDSFNNTSPTDADFTVGTYFNGTLGHPTKYITYLFSTLAGISKVGSYTGNGTSQTIDCGFTSGARFILIKRTDSTGDWYIWDTARGIVTGNDPHLSLNTTAAEVTTDDSIDPASSGFIVNQVAATNINVSAASYIFYAIA